MDIRETIDASDVYLKNYEVTTDPRYITLSVKTLQSALL